VQFVLDAHPLLGIFLFEHYLFSSVCVVFSDLKLQMHFMNNYYNLRVLLPCVNTLCVS
jgi:hypothetical protein